MKVLVVNAGSSSLKYQLIDTQTGNFLAKGICDHFGKDDANIEHKVPTAEGTKKTVKYIPMANHAEGTKVMLDVLTDPELGVIKSVDEIEAVGHRVVHGGPYFTKSCFVTPDVVAKLEKCFDFAPLHTPAHLMGIEGITAVLPEIPQVLVFDTAFHTTLPKYASTYAIHKKDSAKYHIRRYGAHGTSHRFVANEMIKILEAKGIKKKNSKIVTCHIGNGASISAVLGGKCIDTTMGFTPLDGVEMGTRCGSIDPAIVPYLMKKKNLDPDGISAYMNKQCGFLGVSGDLSSDSRDIEAAILKGNKDAWLAANILAYQVKKYIGAFAAAMNGLDAVVFTAGMGENNPELRDRACTGMEYFGIEIDRELNAKTHHQPNVVKLSTENSKVDVYLIPTNEEYMIALDTEELVNKAK